MTVRRVAPLVSFACVLLVGIGLGSLHFLRHQAIGPPKPLPPFHHVVLLFVPGLDRNDWNDWQNARPFTELVWSNPAALAPIPAPLRRPHADALSPDSRLLMACQTVLGKNNRLYSTLRESGVRVVALDATGTVPSALSDAASPAPKMDVAPVSWRVSVPEAAGGEATDPARFARAVYAAFRAPPGSPASPSPPPVLTIAVLDDLFAADTYALLCLPEAARNARQNALGRVEVAVLMLTDEENAKRGGNPPPDAILLVSPVAASHAGQPEENERMGLVVLWNARDQHKMSPLSLTSPSTRRTPGLATFGDIPQTLVQFFRPASEQAAGQSMLGRSLETASAGGGGGMFEKQTRRWAAQWREMRLLVVLPWLLAVLLGASVFCSVREKSRWSAFCVTFACALPVALWMAALFPLLPGIRWIGPPAAIYGCALVPAALVALVPLVRPRLWVPHLRLVSGATVLLLGFDTVLGGPLLARSPLSYSPLEGARFYGIGNESAGIFLGASLLFALLCGKERTGFWARLLAGLGVVAVLGLPTLGANAGATVAALAGWATLLVMDAPPTRRKGAAVLAALCAILLLAGLIGWESRRPSASQTHIGQVAQQTQAGGANGAAVIARRKIAMNAHLAVSSPWAVLLIVEIGLCVFLWRKAKANNTPGCNGAVALFVGAGAAFVANDSGVVMAATCLLFGPPFLLASSNETVKPV